MNFKNWKIVDVDNFMDGNHYFSTLTEESVWQNTVTRTLGGPARVMGEDNTSPNYDREVIFPMI